MTNLAAPTMVRRIWEDQMQQFWPEEEKTDAVIIEAFALWEWPKHGQIMNRFSCLYYLKSSITSGYVKIMYTLELYI